jgi:hypothetical protein
MLRNTKLSGLDKPLINRVLIPIGFLVYEVIIGDIAIIESFSSQSQAAGEPEKLRFLENKVIHGVFSLFLDSVTLQLKELIEILVTLAFAFLNGIETHFLFKVIRVLIFSDSIQGMLFFAVKHNGAVLVAKEGSHLGSHGP